MVSKELVAIKTILKISTYLSVCLSACLSVCLSIYLFIYQSFVLNNTFHSHHVACPFHILYHGLCFYSPLCLNNKNIEKQPTGSVFANFYFSTILINLNTSNSQDISTLLMCSNTSLSQTTMQLCELSNTLFSRNQIRLLTIQGSTIQ